MIEFLKRWVINIVVLVLIIVILEIIVPTGRIKKFVSLISGFLLIIAIITPFLNLFNKGLDIKEFEIQTGSFLDKKEIERKSKILQDNELKQVVEVYRNKIINQVENGAKLVDGVVDAHGDVIINEDYNSNNFGEVIRVYLELDVEKKEEIVEPVKKIDEIKIDVEMDEKDKYEGEIMEEEKLTKGDAEIIKKVEEKISSIINIERDNVVISIE